MIYHVKVSSVDDILELNRIMSSYEDTEFDVKSEQMLVDGKSLLGMLYLGARKFQIHTFESFGKNDFERKIQPFLIKK